MTNVGRIGFDIGGTFTDLVHIDGTTGHVTVAKALTRVHEPAEGVAIGVKQLLADSGVTAADLVLPVHGATTLITNTIIERKGALTALLTTAGFRDVIEIGREWRYDIYDLFQPCVDPLVPRQLRFEVSERMGPDGKMMAPLDLDELSRVVDAIIASGAVAIAVCFINAYVNPAHEKRVGAFISERHPGIHISLSSEVAPEIREYERTSTTVANAYVAPKVSTHFHELRDAVHAQGVNTDVYLMHSSGGIVSIDTAARLPIKLIEFGPAAGALGAAFIGSLMGEGDLISFDMGGTTAKICCIGKGVPTVVNTFEAARLKRFRRGSGIPLLVPVIDVTEIGAGGGSIAHIDRLGLLKVGPQSAAADPGPVSYGRGGTEPTVTDADLVLGYLNPDYFLGGKMALDLDGAKAALARTLGDPLGITLVEAAAGVVRIVNENMANAAKIHLAERGNDPRRYKLIAFGGAGALHGRELASALGIPVLICPLGAGALSALGLLTAPVAMDFQQTAIWPLDQLPAKEAEALVTAMEKKARDAIADAGADLSTGTVGRTAEIRYIGQGYSVTVELPDGAMGDEAWRMEVQRRFEEVYGALYGNLNSAIPLEFITWRIAVSAPGTTLRIGGRDEGDLTIEKAMKGTRSIYDQGRRAFVEAAVYDHYTLPPGSSFRGPAVVEQREATCIIGAGDAVTVDEFQNLRIEVAPNGH